MNAGRARSPQCAVRHYRKGAFDKFTNACGALRRARPARTPTLRHWHLQIRAALGRRVRDNANKRPVRFFECAIEDQGGTRLLDHARSTSQTSPRLGTRLFLVQQGKGLSCDGRQVIVRQRAVITGSHGAGDHLVHRILLDTRQASEPFQPCLCLCAHAFKICPLGEKRASAGNERLQNLTSAKGPGSVLTFYTGRHHSRPGWNQAKENALGSGSSFHQFRGDRWRLRCAPRSLDGETH